MYFVYILCLSDNSFYTGCTGNLKERFLNHKAGTVITTRNKRPLKLVYYEKFNTKKEAIEREKQIKGWSRRKKINLIKHGHPTKID